MHTVYPGINFLSYDMTISAFEAHWQYEQASRASKMIDTAQAVAYSQSTALGKTKLWNSWTSIITRTKHVMNLLHNNGQKSILTWNGETIDRVGLIKKFRSLFGRRAVE